MAVVVERVVLLPGQTAVLEGTKTEWQMWAALQSQRRDRFVY
jgi:hypothetical protein